MTDTPKKPAAKKAKAKPAAKKRAAPAKAVPAPEASSEIAELREMVALLSAQITSQAPPEPSPRDQSVDALTEALQRVSDAPRKNEPRVYLRNRRQVPFKFTLRDPEAPSDARPYFLDFGPRGSHTDVQMLPERLTHHQVFQRNLNLDVIEIIPEEQARAMAEGTFVEQNSSLYEPDPAFAMQMPDGSISSAGPRIVNMPGLNGPMTGSGVKPQSLNVAANDPHLAKLRRDGYLTDEKGRDQWSGRFGGYEESDGKRN